MRWIFLGLLVVGCATKYGPKGYGGGYEEAVVSPGVYYVHFYGNGYTSRIDAVKYWSQRAAELCGGTDRFDVESMENGSSSNGKPRVRGLVKCK